MKKLVISSLALLLSSSVMALGSKINQSGEVILKGETVKVQLQYTKNGFSTRDFINVGKIQTQINSLSATGQIFGTNKSNEEVMLFSKYSFKELLVNFNDFIQISKFDNESEIDCSDNKKNAFIIVFDKDENYLGNCFELK
jgi:hypothetical protein